MAQQINIHSATAGQKLKQDLKIISQKLSKRLNSLMDEILEDALSNKDIYSIPVKDPRQKGGNHISITTDEKKNEIVEWAKKEGSTLSLWSNHILEKSIELNYNNLLNS